MEAETYAGSEEERPRSGVTRVSFFIASWKLESERREEYNIICLASLQVHVHVHVEH